MNKFTKVKKALAVSVCGTMLFSGAHKTSGMNFFKSLGNSISQAAIWESIGRTVNTCVESRSVSLNSEEAKNIYKKACYFLKTFANSNEYNFDNDQAHISLTLARKYAIYTEKSKMCKMCNCINPCYWLRISKISDNTEQYVRSMIKELLTAFPDTINSNEYLRKLINSAKTSDFPEESIEKIFNKIIELKPNDFSSGGLNSYVNGLEELPEVNEIITDVIHNVGLGGGN